MKKRLLTTLLALSLLLTLLPVTAWAADWPTSGACGENLTWSWAGDTLTISGTGEMTNRTIYDAPIWGYYARDYVTSVVVENGVTTIGDYAFDGFSHLTSVNLPSSLITIGAGAFEFCKELTSMDIPSGVVSIGDAAFEDCSRLTGITLPSTLTRIGKNAFWNCESLTKIDIPYGVTAIESGTFTQCYGLTSVTIPSSVTSIESGAFTNCFGLTDADIPASVASIGWGAFQSCHSLTSAVIPAGITSIKAYTFCGCTSLTSVTIPASVTAIEMNAFTYCGSMTGGLLSDVYYGGTAAEWKSVKIDYDDYPYDNVRYGYNNDALRHVTVHYDSTGMSSAGENPKPDKPDKPDVPAPQEYHVYCNGGSEKFTVSLEDWVKENSAKYHPELAHMLMAMSSSVKSETDIRKTFESFGFAPGDIRTDYRLSEILEAYGMAKKQIGNQTLVVIALRGTDADMEVIDDLTGYLPPALTGQQSGFRSAALMLYDKVTSSDFLGTTDFSNTKFVLTGFSRGAGVANLLAARLIDDGVAEKNVYAYTFACPDSAIVDDNTAGRYRTIFNISNINDFVSWSPSGWLTGYGKWFKYGQSYWFAHDWSDYQNLEMALDFDNIHNEGKYLEYLRDNNDKSITDYKTRREAKKVLDFAVKWRNEKFWNDVQNNFLSFVGIRCPVDVEIYDSDQLVGGITNNLAQVNDAGKIYISVLNDEKDIYLLTDGEYTFKLTAAGKGTMEYIIQNIDVETRTAIDVQSFKNVTLTPGKAFTSAVTVAGNTAAGVKEQEIKLYVLDTAGEPAKEVDSSGTETPITPPPSPEHTHVWETAWSCDETHHWKECSTSECPIKENSSKSEYGEHTYDKKNETVCSTCKHKRAVNPLRPAAEEETYYIFILGIMNGEIIPNTRYASPGERVTLTAHPDKGYKLDTITVTDIRGRTLVLRELSGNSYSFAMPDNRVTVNASFAKIENNTSSASAPAEDELFTGLGTPGISGIVLNPAPMPFTDVRAGDWFYGSVDYVWKHYLMSGVSGIEFSPNTTTSRAMIWTVLARMNNVRTEVNPGSNWYERGMLWAMEQGITDGSNPMGDITCEQLATMLWRNAGSPGATADLSRFSDSGSVSDYAKSAVNWAVANGILNGSDGKLNPKGTATRAQVAAMVMRYGEHIGA